MDNLIMQKSILRLLIKCKWERQLKRQGAWLRAGRPGFEPGCRKGWDFSLPLHVQTGPEVHSASYKMSTGGFPREVKAAERKTSHPTSSQCRGCEYVDHCSHIHRGPSWSVMGIPLSLLKCEMLNMYGIQQYLSESNTHPIFET